MRNRLSDSGYVNPCPIEHASGGSEVVLHVDNENRGLGEIKFKGAWPRINSYRAARRGTVLRFWTCPVSVDSLSS